MGFPYEAEPDGNSLRSHHLLSGLYLAIGASLYAGRAPLLALGGGLAVFAFVHVWPRFPVVGAGLTLAGVLVALTAALTALLSAVTTFTVATTLAVLVAADDAVSHALGWPTPLDYLWGTYLYGWLPST